MEWVYCISGVGGLGVYGCASLPKLDMEVDQDVSWGS